MKLSNLSARFWVAVALILGTLLLGLIGPLIVGTDPNDVIGGLYDPPNGSSIACGSAPTTRARACWPTSCTASGPRCGSGWSPVSWRRSWA